MRCSSSGAPCSAAAARPKCNRSATAMKYLIWRKSGRLILPEYYRTTAIVLDGVEIRFYREAGGRAGPGLPW